MANPEIPLQETLEFIERFLPRECSRILDVGCGSGELAERALGRRYVARMPR